MLQNICILNRKFEILIPCKYNSNDDDTVHEISTKTAHLSFDVSAVVLYFFVFN